MVTDFALDPPASVAILAHAAAAYPEEACGILVGLAPGMEVGRALPQENQAPPELRRRRFTIDPAEVLRLQKELRGTGESILGFYHSHPDHAADLSRTDLKFLRLWPRTLWLIVPVHGGLPAAPRAWWLDEEGSDPRELFIRA